jgi:hypothetical protein
MHRGSCLCGAVAYEITGALGDAHHCHCGICRKSHGAAFSTFVQVARADFRFTRGEDQVRRYQSSPPCVRSFCATCGTRLQFLFEGMPDALWVAVPTLDDQEAVAPHGHMFVASKAPWYAITDALPRWDGYPPID